MVAALLQGVPATTLNTDLWIDLPERQYVRVLDLCRSLGATIIARTVVALADDTLVNFLYRVDGLKSFAAERKKALQIKWLGTTVNVLPLERIIRSKEVVHREKDVAHLPLLKQKLGAQLPLRQGGQLLLSQRGIRLGRSQHRGGGVLTPCHGGSLLAALALRSGRAG